MEWPRGFRLSREQFGQREKSWVILLVVVMAGVVGVKTVVQPRRTAAGEARATWARVGDELARLQAQRPDLDARRIQVDGLRARVANIFKELEQLETGLLRRQDEDLLLEQLVADRQRFQLQINTVKPMRSDVERPASQKEGEPSAFYQQLLVQLDLYGAYDDLVSYVKALEAQRPYQRVQGVKVKIEGQEWLRPHALLLVETLLADAPETVAQRRQAAFGAEGRTERGGETKDPFLAKEKPKEEVETVDMELTGIFGDGALLTAMINGQGYQVGDLIQGRRVVAILADRVVLEQGARRFVVHSRRTEP